MRKVIAVFALLALATCAFAQQSYVGSGYTGNNTARTAQDSYLGFHDVMASATGNNANNAVQRNGCQSCHVPHEAAIASTSTQDGYLWKYDISAVPAVSGGNTITLDSASFHTLACLGCHNGTTAADVALNFNWSTHSYAQMGVGGDLSHDHPLNAMLAQHGATPPKKDFVRFYTPSGYTLQVNGVNGYTGGTEFGYVECGSCHDPHKGDANTYDFLRGPAAGVSYTDPKDATITYVGTSPQYARLGLCRECHGK